MGDVHSNIQSEEEEKKGGSSDSFKINNKDMFSDPIINSRLPPGSMNYIPQMNLLNSPDKRGFMPKAISAAMIPVSSDKSISHKVKQPSEIKDEKNF